MLEQTQIRLQKVQGRPSIALELRESGEGVISRSGGRTETLGNPLIQFLFCGWLSGSSRREFFKAAAENSPSPWGEGRDEVDYGNNKFQNANAA